jgi:hypothetical protein
MRRRMYAPLEPSALEMMQMMYVSLGDIVPPLCHAHFVHGAPAAEEQHYERLLHVVADHYHSGTVNVVVINGLSVDECKRQSHGYCGFEIYRDILTDFGIPEKRIALLPSSPHTAAESRNLLNMARSRGWQHLIVSSLPHHQLRCFLQIVALLERPYWFKVYNMTTGGISLLNTVSKPAWIGSRWPSVSAPLVKHFEEEFNRILRYAREPRVVDGVPEFTRHATIPEALAYVHWRDTR